MAQRLTALALLLWLVASPAAGQDASQGEPAAPEPSTAAAPQTEPAQSATPAAPSDARGRSTNGASDRSTAAPSQARGSSTRGASDRSSATPSSRRTTPSRPGPDRADQPEEEEEEDEWGAFYIQLLGGYSFANLVSFRQENFLPEAERLEGSGFFGGAGLGFRVHILTIGGQATLASYAPTEADGFELGTVIGTLALHLPVPGIQPYFRIGAGYAWMGKANYMDPGISETRVYGFVVEGGFGVDIKLARPISIGLGVDAAYLNLGRQSASEVGMIDDVNFEEDGDAVGYQIRGHVHLTFHI